MHNILTTYTIHQPSPTMNLKDSYEISNFNLLVLVYYISPAPNEISQLGKLCSGEA